LCRTSSLHACVVKHPPLRAVVSVEACRRGRHSIRAEVCRGCPEATGRNRFRLLPHITTPASSIIGIVRALSVCRWDPMSRPKHAMMRLMELDLRRRDRVRRRSRRTCIQAGWLAALPALVERVRSLAHGESRFDLFAAPATLSHESAFLYQIPKFPRHHAAEMLVRILPSWVHVLWPIIAARRDFARDHRRLSGGAHRVLELANEYSACAFVTSRMISPAKSLSGRFGSEFSNELASVFFLLSRLRRAPF